MVAHQSLSLKLFFSFCLIFAIANADLDSQIRIWMVDSETNSSYTVFSKNGIESVWNTRDVECGACNAPSTAVEFASSDNTSFLIQNIGQSNVKISSLELSAENKEVISLNTDIISPSVIEAGKNITFSVLYDCKNQTILKNNLNGWSYVEVSLMIDDNPVKFNYMKICTLENNQRSDYSIYILLLIAVLVVAIQTRQKYTLLGDQAQNMDEIQPIHAVFFIVFASISLLTLYFFSEYIKGLLSVIFVLYSLTGCSVIFATWTEKYFKHSAFWTRHYQIPCIGAVNLHSMLCFVFSSILVGSWYFTRNWILNNMIGLSFVSLIFRVVKLPSLKVAYLLLGLAFFYDIFWVFLSKPIFGKSVMVVAATSLDLPIKIEWPYFGATPLPRCSLLGLGDMVLPGFFVTFNYRFGLYKKTKAYYWSSIIAYAIGIGICGAVLAITKVGQPALLYIVPALLGAATIVSLQRKEFKSMWNGIPESHEYLEMSRDMESNAIQMSEPHLEKK